MVSSALRRWLEQLLHTHDTPRRTAAAYALGVFFGFSPLLGLHTILGVVCAFALNLNRVAVVLGVYTNLPWILPAYYTLATLGGAALLNVDMPPGFAAELRQGLSAVSWAELGRLGRALAPFAWSFVLGSTLGALALAAVAYKMSLAMIVAHRRHAARMHGESPGPD